jgi:hypothetical protein
VRDTSSIKFAVAWLAVGGLLACVSCDTSNAPPPASSPSMDAGVPGDGGPVNDGASTDGGSTADVSRDGV